MRPNPYFHIPSARHECEFANLFSYFLTGGKHERAGRLQTEECCGKERTYLGAIVGQVDSPPGENLAKVAKLSTESIKAFCPQVASATLSQYYDKASVNSPSSLYNLLAKRRL